MLSDRLFSRGKCSQRSFQDNSFTTFNEIKSVVPQPDLEENAEEKSLDKMYPLDWPPINPLYCIVSNCGFI